MRGRNRGDIRPRADAVGRVLKDVFVEFGSLGMTYFGVGSVILDEIGTLYSVGGPGQSDRQYKPSLDDDEAETADFSSDFNNNQNMGEGLDPLLSAGSSTIQSEDLLRRSAPSRNHPSPTTSTATIWFSLPRASLYGTVIYEDTALLAGLMIGGQKGIGA